MKFIQQQPLQQLNTFGIATTAANYVKVTSLSDVQTIVTDRYWLSQGIKVIGGGSNILLTQPLDGLLVHNQLKGISVVAEDEQFVYLKAAAGEQWHDVVMYAVANNWGGIENLSLIPGCVGASPMQNIGAYGVEIKDVFHSLEAIAIGSGELVTFSEQDCQFGYRESVFKRALKGQYVIVSVTYQLRKQPIFNTSYGAIEQELAKACVTNLTVKAISDAVIRIRTSKLPNPSVIGNAGSFFKNPTISASSFALLQATYPEIVGYHLPQGDVKLAAGWLIEKAGFKGWRSGDVGCHNKQALVLVNYGKASGSDVLALATNIIDKVKAMFGVALEPEVNIW
ncbi:MAG: UDP-N-acetylmuramate dehydrogenase [Chitinophagaceae bacterium]